MTRAIGSVSVIIPTYGRPELASQVLEMLHQQTRPPDEVVVVSQTEDGRPDERVRAPESHTYRLNILHHRPLGTSAARNRGAEASRGDLLVFLDDDVRFEPDLIQQYVRIFEEEPNVDVVQGGICEPGGQLPAVRRIKRDADLFRFFAAPANCSRRSMAIGLASGNFAVVRQWFLAVGGFDENLKGKGDDYDIGLRLFRSGALMVYHPRPCVVHMRAAAGGTRSNSPRAMWARWFQPHPNPGWTYLLLKNLPVRAAYSELLGTAASCLWPRRTDPLRPLKWPFLAFGLIRSVIIARQLISRGPVYLLPDRSPQAPSAELLPHELVAPVEGSGTAHTRT